MSETSLQYFSDSQVFQAVNSGRLELHLPKAPYSLNS